MHFQDLILTLDRFWARRGCSLVPSCAAEAAPGVPAPAFFFGALTSSPAAVAGAAVCRRPADARFGRNPARQGIHHQYRVLIKPPSEDLRRAYLDSLKALGLRAEEHDVRWLASARELPLAGSSGAGWEIRADGLPVSRFTYLRRMGSFRLEPACVEIRYGLERLALLVQKKKRFDELTWDDRLGYGAVHGEREEQFSRFVHGEDGPAPLRAELEAAARRCGDLLAKNLYLPAYEEFLKGCRGFALLDARRELKGTERTEFETKLKNAARACAAAYADREEPGWTGRNEAAERPAAHGASHE